ncbi:MAG TPA: hypothetical protein VKX49_09730 [Bryobacteraceae bacterium]|nr:hypothetical protein [Bryobacteraceae bacterium]
MPAHLEIPAQYGDVRECIRAAQGNLERVKQLLRNPSVEASEASAAILREVEVQLGCIVALWKTAAPKADGELRTILQNLQQEVAVLAELFAQADKMFTGWLRAIQSKRAGYTGDGHAAPLVLVNQVSLEG